MSLSLLFWVIYIISVVFGLWSNWPLGADKARGLGLSFVVLVLIGLLGWQVFGAAVHR